MPPPIAHVDPEELQMIASKKVGRPNSNSKYKPESVLRNLDLSNLEELKCVMTVLDDAFKLPYFEMLDKYSQKNNTMSRQTRAVVNRMLKTIRDTKYLGRPLLSMAVRRWAAAFDKNDSLVIKYTKELTDLASAAVLCTPTGSRSLSKLYDDAFKTFKLRERAERVPAGPAPSVSTISVASDDDGVDEVEIVPSGPSQKSKDIASRYVKSSGKGAITTKRPVATKQKDTKVARAGVKKERKAKKSGAGFIVKPEFKACNTCKEAHSKCDRAQPICGKCSKNGAVCKYERW